MNINAGFVHGAIDGLAARFENQEDYISRSYRDIEYDENGEPYEIEYEIDNEIGFMLDGLGVQHEIEMVEAFSNPAVDIWVLCVSFIINKKLYMHNLIIERR